MGLFNIKKGGAQGAKVYDLGTGTSFNVKTILEGKGISMPDSFYQSLTNANFLMNTLSNEYVYKYGYASGAVMARTSYTKSYNNSTFVLTCTLYVEGYSENNVKAAVNNRANVYLIPEYIVE